MAEPIEEDLRKVIRDAEVFASYAAAERCGRCVRCGRDTIKHPVSGRLTHLAADGGSSVGCRAASYTHEHGWNDAVPKSWRVKVSG